MYEIEVEGTDIESAELENFKNLCLTTQGSIPLERDKGLDMSFLDMPPPIAKNMFMVEIIKKAHMYTDLEVEDVSFMWNEDGKLSVKVVVGYG